MVTIYDNIEKSVVSGLKGTLELSKRADFCVGYFNLRGWKAITLEIDNLLGEEIQESHDQVHRHCRLLVGMQKSPIDIVREQYNQDEARSTDQSEVAKIKKRLALDFREQLTIGVPTNADEKALRDLSRQMKEGKIVSFLRMISKRQNGLLGIY